jgi:hypothetical protein
MRDCHKWIVYVYAFFLAFSASEKKQRKIYDRKRIKKQKMH